MPSAKKEQALREILAPHLRPDETVELITAAGVGQVSAARQATVAAAAAVLSGGMFAVALRPKGYYLAVTQQRLLLVDVNRTSGMPIAPQAAPLAVPRPIRAVPAGGLLAAKWDLLDGDGAALCQVSFAWTVRSWGKKLAAALDN